MTIYPETGTNAQFTLAKAALLKGVLQPLTILFPSKANNGNTKAALLNARVLIDELRQDISKLRTQAGKALLARIAEQGETVACDADIAAIRQSKALGMVHHLKHTKNSIAAERLN